jgi:hypothetical protein
MFDRGTYSVMERCNPSWVFSINTSYHHRTSNNEQSRVTNAFSFFVSSIATSPRLLHLVRQCVSMTGRAGLRNHRPQRSCTGRGRIRFLRSDLHDCSIHFSKFVYLDRTRSLITSTANFVSLRTVFKDLLLFRKTRTHIILESCLTY